MNRARTSAIVLLLASAAAAYEQQDRSGPEEVHPAAPVAAAVQEHGPVLRDRLEALVAWALGRERRMGSAL